MTIKPSTTSDRVAMALFAGLVVAVLVVVMLVSAPRANAWFGVALTGQADCAGVSTWTLTGDGEHAGAVAGGLFVGPLDVNETRQATSTDTSLTVTVARVGGGGKAETVTADAVPATGCEPPVEPPVVVPPKTPDKPEEPGVCEDTTNPCARDTDLVRVITHHKCGQLLSHERQLFINGQWVTEHVTYSDQFDSRLCAPGQFVETG